MGGGTVFIDQGSSQNTVSDVTANGVFENPQSITTTTNGQNTVTFSTLSFVFVNGNTTGTPTNDTFANNRISGALTVSGADGTTITGNTITAPFVGVSISNGAATPVSITNNTITATLVGVSITQIGATDVFNVAIRGNTISTANKGSGISVVTAFAAGAGSKVTVTIEGNDLRGNKVGLSLNGTGFDEVNALGSIDAGGGGGSSGGNNFRGYTAAGVASGSFAISATNGTAGTKGSVSAKGNLFSVADPTTVIRDGSHNTGAAGYGAVTVSALSATDALIDAAYFDALGRAASSSELTPWEAILASSGPAAVAFGIANSPEALNRAVDKLYLYLLRRTSDAGGRAGWVAYLQRGGTLEGVGGGIVSSPEFINKVPTFGFPFGFPAGVPVNPNSQYVVVLYNLLLGRNPSADEAAAWVGVLGNQTPVGVAAGIVNSLELRFNVVRQFYFGFLGPTQTGLGLPNLMHRVLTPSAGEVAGWVFSGLDILSIEAAFIATVEFQTNG